jgi:hypothetical protein
VLISVQSKYYCDVRTLSVWSSCAYTGNILDARVDRRFTYVTNFYQLQKDEVADFYVIVVDIMRSVRVMV